MKLIKTYVKDLDYRTYPKLKNFVESNEDMKYIFTAKPLQLYAIDARDYFYTDDNVYHLYVGLSFTGDLYPAGVVICNSEEDFDKEKIKIDNHAINSIISSLKEFISATKL